MSNTPELKAEDPQLRTAQQRTPQARFEEAVRNIMQSAQPSNNLNDLKEAMTNLMAVPNLGERDTQPLHQGLATLATKALAMTHDRIKNTADIPTQTHTIHELSAAIQEAGCWYQMNTEDWTLFTHILANICQIMETRIRICFFLSTPAWGYHPHSSRRALLALKEMGQTKAPQFSRQSKEIACVNSLIAKINWAINLDQSF